MPHTNLVFGALKAAIAGAPVRKRARRCGRQAVSTARIVVSPEVNQTVRRRPMAIETSVPARRGDTSTPLAAPLGPLCWCHRALARPAAQPGVALGCHPNPLWPSPNVGCYRRPVTSCLPRCARLAVDPGVRRGSKAQQLQQRSAL
jgi:hypothetical protein